MSLLINFTPLTAKLTVKLVTKPINTKKRKYVQPGKASLKQTREFLSDCSNFAEI